MSGNNVVESLTERKNVIVNHAEEAILNKISGLSQRSHLRNVKRRKRGPEKKRRNNP